MLPLEKRTLWNKVRKRFHNDWASPCNNYKASLELSVLLQTDEWYDYMNGVWYPMTEKLKRQLQALSGPHAETLFKVLLARKEMKK